jgi:PAS domain S-box-containing protein
MLGYSKEEFDRLDYQSLVHPEDRNPAIERIQKRLTDESPDLLPTQMRILTKSGHIKWIEANSVKMPWDGRPAIQAYINDITERKLSEDALRESEKRYREILENVLVGVYQVTFDGKFIFANQKMTEMFGYSSFEELEAIGSIAKLYVRPEDRPKIVDEIMNKGFINDALEFQHKDGRSIWVRLHTRKTRNKEGTIILEGLMEDVTEIKEMEARMRQTQKMESIGNLAGGIAHDFNNILSAIIGFTELSLEDVEKGTDIENNLQEVYIAGKRAKDLVKQILAFARQSEQEIKPIRIDTITKEAVKFIRSSFQLPSKSINRLIVNLSYWGTPHRFIRF